MEKVIYAIDGEWELGQRYVVFTSYEAAEKWLRKILVDIGVEEGFEDLLESGLVVIYEIDVID